MFSLMYVAKLCILLWLYLLPFYLSLDKNLKKSANFGGKSQVNISMDKKYERLLPAVFAEPL